MCGCCWDERQWGAKQDRSHTYRGGPGNASFPTSPQKQDAFCRCVAKAVGVAASLEAFYVAICAFLGLLPCLWAGMMAQDLGGPE